MALVLVEGEDRLPALLGSTNVTRLGNSSSVSSSSSGTTAQTSSPAHRLSPGPQLLEAVLIVAFSAFLV